MNLQKTIILFFILIAGLILLFFQTQKARKPQVLSATAPISHWLLLHRKSNIEYLYLGTPGDTSKSTLQRTFKVKSGIPGQRPTPLPKLLGREYWIITKKEESSTDPETSPYFLTLDIPTSENFPYGPTPYLECSGQCDWVIPGNFGLHGVNGDNSRLLNKNFGSSGCIRHFDDDITYLYNLLDPEKEKIRYYIKDI